MLEGSRRTSAPSRSALRIKWDNKRDEIRLLQLVKSNPDYRVTFFPAGMVRRQQYKLGAELCVEFLQGDADQIRDWRRRGLVEKGAGGAWKPTKAWDSRVANPVTTKLRELKKSYEVAQDKYGGRLNPAWTKFAEVPNSIRVDLVDICPFYFHLRPLFDKPPPMDDEDLPPIRLPSPRAPRRPSPATSGRPNRRVNGAPPSPSPSPSPATRTAASTRPPPPRPGPADAGPSTPFIPDRSRTNVPARSPDVKPFEHLRSHANPNRQPISIPSSSASSRSSSNTSAASTTSESEHDMENDWGSVKSDSGSPVHVDWLNLNNDITPHASRPWPSRAEDGSGSRKRSASKVHQSPEPRGKRHRDVSPTTQAIDPGINDALDSYQQSLPSYQDDMPMHPSNATDPRQRRRIENIEMRRRYKRVRPSGVGDKLFAGTVFWAREYQEVDIEALMSPEERQSYLATPVYRRAPIKRSMQLQWIIDGLRELEATRSLPLCATTHRIFLPQNSPSLVKELVDYAVKAGAVICPTPRDLTRSPGHLSAKTRIRNDWYKPHAEPGAASDRFWQRSPTAFGRVICDHIVRYLVDDKQSPV